MKTLDGKVAIITGASSGIGRATALLLAKEGAKCVVSARRQDKLDDLVAEIEADNGHAIALAGDVRDEALAKESVDIALSVFGGLDIGFNNAGTLGALGPIADMSVEAWHETLDTNLTSAFLGAKYQIPAMIARGGGAIVFTSSFVGHTVGMAGLAAYGASKAGLVGLSQGLAAEHGAQGVRVNAILPGGTTTPMGAVMTATPESKAYIEGLHGLKRMAHPEEIARSVLYLVSDASGFVTGTAHLVDGGFSIYRA
ncbi:MAG: short-chain dehydrogenase [Robiginitomaculum sp.]|nr:MAG: short-chain dehydrogenase [Robiginitomaculum sp.]